MNVLIVNHESLTHMSGAEKFIIRLGKALYHRGFNVKIVAFPFNKNSKKIKFIETELGGIPYEEKILNLERERYEVVYVNYAPFIWRLLAGRVKAPKIAGFHGAVLLPEFQHRDLLKLKPLEFIRYLGFKQFLAYFTFNKIKSFDLSKFNAIHIPNPSIKLSFKGLRIYSIPNWVDSIYFKKVCKKGDEFFVLFVGRVSWEKGFDIVVNIVKKILYLNPDIKFVLPKKLPFKNVITYSFLSEEELIDMYCSASVVLYPSRTDIFSLVILEALATGTPIITSNIPSHQNYLNKCVHKANTLSEYINSILKLYELKNKHEEKFKELTYVCKNYVKNNFSEEKIVPQIISMFKDVATSSKNE